MTDPVTVGEIIAQYAKHGWIVRRALLSNESKSVLMGILGDIEVEFSDFDALWFSRRSQPANEAWELRRLSGSPFALVAVVPADASFEEREMTLSQVADEMSSKTIA